MIIHISGTKDHNLIDVIESFLKAQNEIAKGEVLDPPERRFEPNPKIVEYFNPLSSNR